MSRDGIEGSETPGLSSSQPAPSEVSSEELSRLSRGPGGASAPSKGHSRSSSKTLSGQFQQLQVSEGGTSSEERSARLERPTSWNYHMAQSQYTDPYAPYRYMQGQYPPLQWRPFHPGMADYRMYGDTRQGMYFDPRMHHMQGMQQFRPGYPMPMPGPGQHSYPGMMDQQYRPMIAYPYSQTQARPASGRQRPSRTAKLDAEPTESYEFDEQEVENTPDSCRRTLMLRNIPNKYSIHMLLEMLDKAHGKGTGDLVYDFCYLPIDFKNRCNLGYAFVNFIDAESTLTCYKAFHGKRWNDFNSKKVCEVKYGRVQGRDALVEHFKNSKFPSNDIDSLPLLFEKVEKEDGTAEICSVPLHSKQAPALQPNIPL